MQITRTKFVIKMYETKYLNWLDSSSMFISRSLEKIF